MAKPETAYICIKGDHLSYHLPKPEQKITPDLLKLRYMSVFREVITNKLEIQPHLLTDEELLKCERELNRRRKFEADRLKRNERAREQRRQVLEDNQSLISFGI
jgi:hypothetical protein